MHRSAYLAPLGLVLLAPLAARADVTHVIGKGHTIETIAHRYHVSPKAIIEANHLKDTKHLKVGDTLIIPGVQAPKNAAHGKDHKGADDKLRAGDGETPLRGSGAPADGHGAAASTHTTARVDHEAEKRREADDAADRRRGLLDPTAPHHDAYEAKPKEADVVHATRLGENFTIRVKDHHGKIPPAAIKEFGKLMRSGSAEHGIDPRLVALVGIVSNHFGGRELEVVSGFRPYSPTQYTPHSNHNFGKALDFRVRGVPNETLRDFCRTLRNVGVGYYPNSTFVHLDVREAPGFWIDYSRPGEPPRYNSPNVSADEGTSDVPEDAHGPDPASDPASSDNPYDTR
jgi:uncharacterized protein YcbK (DUF882 family)/LysM repeat protein